MSARTGRRTWLKATSSLGCVIAALASACADEPGAVDPAQLPESVDVGSLRGRELAGTSCTFGSDLKHGSAGSGDVRVWLECPETKDGGVLGFVQVTSGPTGDGAAEDTVECHSDARSPTLHGCNLRHRMITVNARAWGAADKWNPEKQARELMASVVELLATLPEEPCRQCPDSIPPRRVAELTKMFSGTGTKQLGTIQVEVDSRIRYVVVPQGGIRITTGRPPQVLLEDRHHQGQDDIPRGTYHQVKVSSSGESWNFLIEPR